MQTEMVVASEDTENMYVRDEFIEILMSSNVARNSVKGIEPSPKQIRMIRSIETRMNKLFTDRLNSEDAKPHDAIALAQSYLHISQIYSDVLWKDSAEAYLLRCLGLLEGKETTRKAVLTTMKVYNCLGRIYATLNNPKRSVAFYEKAFLFYLTYTNKKDLYPAPTDILYIFGIVTKEFQSGYSLDRQYMSTLSSLIQLHEQMDKELYKSIITIYQHMLLQKQVKLIPITIGRIEWALKVAMVAEYLIEQNRFTEARSHIGIAFYMLNKFYRNEYGKINGNSFPEIKASLHNQYVDAAVSINMFAVQYGIALLRSSKDRLLQCEKDMLEETKPQYLTTIEQKLPDHLIFATTNNTEEEFNNWITDKYVVNYNDANAIFLCILRRLNEARSYNTRLLQTDSQISILVEMASACKYLACYEQTGNKQMMLHSWRLDLLNDALKLFSKQNKNNGEKLTLLQLAITNVTLLDTHLDELHFYQKSKLDSTPNINYYVKHALDNFKLYLNQA